MSDSREPATQRLTGAKTLVEYLVRPDVRYAAGIPGHGCWAIVDALIDRRDAIRTVQVMHEQSAVHLVDGWHRVARPDEYGRVKVDRDLAVAGPEKTGWWDAPSPEHDPAQRARYLAGPAEEQHR
jgi:hypothetical protein